MEMSLKGRRVLLTGASGGIGQALARTLHARGATIVATARREDVLDELAQRLGDRVEPLVADLCDRDQVESLPESAGAVDVLVANAGLPSSGALGEMSVGRIDRSLEVNLRAPMQLSRALAPGMARRGQGALCFIGSLSGKVASPGSALYSATKFGLRGFALGLREDLADTGVTVTSVYPGFVKDAGMFHDSGARVPSYIALKTPEEVAEATVRGIERGALEVDVAPWTLRLAAKAGGLAPRLVGDAQRRLGGRSISDQMAEGQRDKR